MKKLDEGHRPQFFNLTVEGYEQELSPELQALAHEFARQMAEGYYDRRKGCYDLLKQYPDDDYLKERWTDENIEKYASGEDDPGAIGRVRKKPFEQITQHDMRAIVAQDAERASIIMKAIYDGAKDYLAAGLHAANAIGFNEPFKHFQFVAIRTAFIDEWQPRGGIEASLVDMLAQCYVAWQIWLARSFEVANNLDSVVEQVKKSKTMYDESGSWNSPRLTAAEYLERATQMADRFQRMYLRTLRQMRDLRRYASPVVVKNAGQVNIAADGGQQVNVQQRKGKKAAKGKRQPMNQGARKMKAVE